MLEHWVKQLEVPPLVLLRGWIVVPFVSKPFWYVLCHLEGNTEKNIIWGIFRQTIPRASPLLFQFTDSLVEVWNHLQRKAFCGLGCLGHRPQASDTWLKWGRRMGGQDQLGFLLAWCFAILYPFQRESKPKIERNWRYTALFEMVSKFASDQVIFVAMTPNHPAVPAFSWQTILYKYIYIQRTLPLFTGLRTWSHHRDDLFRRRGERWRRRRREPAAKPGALWWAGPYVEAGLGILEIVQVHGIVGSCVRGMKSKDLFSSACTAVEGIPCQDPWLNKDRQKQRSNEVQRAVRICK